MKKSRKEKIRVLIPDGESLITLWVINCLSVDKDIEIHLVSAKKWVESRFSKHVSSFAYCPPGISQDQRFDFLKRRIEDLDIHVLLPIIVPSIRYVSKYKKDFQALGLEIQVPGIKQLDLANCKGSLAKFLHKNGLPHPRTYDSKELKKEKDLPFPLLIKPLSSWNGRGLSLAKNEEELRGLVEREERFIAQEYLTGEDYCVNVICQEGEIKQYSIQKGIIPSRHSFRPNLGAEFVEAKPLLSIVEHIMAELNWTGVANFDVLKEAQTENYFIIEMNPRFWGSVEASQRVGVNFPLLYVQSVLGEKLDSKPYRKESYISNKGLVNTLMHFVTFQWGKLRFARNNSLAFALQDPLPKVFKYTEKIFLLFSKASGKVVGMKGFDRNIAP